MPPSLGVKPRKYCSKACLKGYSQKPAFAPCRVCGAAIPQTASAGRLRVLCSKKCKSAASKGQPKTFVCKACEQPFASCYKKDYCSERCRWPRRIGDTIKCGICGEGFVLARHHQKYCSQPCAAEAIRRRNEKAGQRSSERAQRFDCLNCGKKYVARNRSRCSFKYCSRECAFEARRLKKPCAKRPLEAASQLARWFLSWGDDQWPIAASCECGDRFVSQRSRSAEVHATCPACRHRKATPPQRQCPDCYSEVPDTRRYCRDCGGRRKKESRRRNKREHRRRHGGNCTFRQRCKKYGAPFTRVSKQAVMERDKWRCQLCREPLLHKYTTILGTRTPHPRSPTIDHIVPLSFGPSSPGHVFDNCQAACWACNCERGTEDADSFARRKATGLDY